MPLRPHEKEAFVDMMTAAAAIYGRDVSPTLIQLYWNALAPYDLSAVRQAFNRHVTNPDTGQFWPKPADLIRMLGGSSLDAAMQAWATVERAIRLVGGYESVVFDDPIVHRCIDDMGGWQKLCEGTEDELPFVAKKFENLYRGYALRRENVAYPGRLIGRFEAKNRIQGHPVEPPVFIGDPQKCQQVLKMDTGHGLRITHAGEAAAALLDA